MDTATWVETGVAAYGAVVATAVAGYQLASRRRRLFLVARVDFRDLDNAERDDWKDLDGRFPVLVATIVNTGARPVEASDAGLVLRVRGQRRLGISRVTHLANANRA